MIRPVTSVRETPAECDRERDVLEAIALNRAEPVRDHLRTCASCAELAQIAGALHQEYDAACREARVPSGGAVWWRATIRARAEAARTVSQPITVAQSVAGAAALGLACGVVGVVWRAFDGVGGAGEFLARVSERSDIAPALSMVLQHALPLTLGLAACLVAAPVALYFALSDD
jgi:hypothetical protein